MYSTFHSFYSIGGSRVIVNTLDLTIFSLLKNWNFLSLCLIFHQKSRAHNEENKNRKSNRALFIYRKMDFFWVFLFNFTKNLVLTRRKIKIINPKLIVSISTIFKKRGILCSPLKKDDCSSNWKDGILYSVSSLWISSRLF
jgi:hypothetical protein